MRLRRSGSLDYDLARVQDWLCRIALTVPSPGLGLVGVLLLALELLDIGYGSNSSDQFSSGFTSLGDIFECERVRDGDSGSVVNGLNINVDCAWR